VDQIEPLLEDIGRLEEVPSKNYFTEDLDDVLEQVRRLHTHAFATPNRSVLGALYDATKGDPNFRKLHEFTDSLRNGRLHNKAKNIVQRLDKDWVNRTTQELQDLVTETEDIAFWPRTYMRKEQRRAQRKPFKSMTQKEIIQGVVNGVSPNVPDAMKWYLFWQTEFFQHNWGVLSSDPFVMPTKHAKVLAKFWKLQFTDALSEVPASDFQTFAEKINYPQDGEPHAEFIRFTHYFRIGFGTLLTFLASIVQASTNTKHTRSIAGIRRQTPIPTI